VWLQIGMALKAEMGDAGRALWDGWSRRSEKYDERDQYRTWKSFDGHGINIGTLFYLAQQAGWKPQRETSTATSGNHNSGGNRKKRNPNGKQLVVYDASSVAPVPTEWVWPGRIAIGKTTPVGGDPGLGKSQLSIFIASIISQAGKWPCKEGTSPKRSVIMLSAEDGVADTIIPRLMAAGADREQGQDRDCGS